jgi:hypothetical protein
MLFSPNQLRVALLCLIPLSACDKLAEAVSEGAKAVAEEKTGGLTGGEKTEDDRLSDKLQPYIECINQQSHNVTDSASRYFRWLPDPAVAPTAKETGVSLLEIRDIKQCVDGITKSADQDPDDPALEGVAKAYADALTAVYGIANEAHKYYDEKNFEDDKFAKAQEMHPKLVAAFDAFAAADKALREAVTAKNDALQERDLGRVEAEMGQVLLWHHKKTMLLAKHVMDIGDVAVSPEFALDLAEFEPALTEYEKQVDALNAYAKAHTAEADSVTLYSSLESDVDDFKKAAKEMLRRKRDNKAFTDSEFKDLSAGFGDRVEGSPAKLSDSYNELVSASNRLNYSRYAPPPK